MLAALRRHPLWIIVFFTIAVLAIWYVHQRSTPAMVRQVQMGWLPDPEKTPGTVDPNVTLDQVCHQRTGLRRSVSEAKKRRVRSAYGLVGKYDAYCATAEGCEIDHLCPVELGCSNDETNLWPQPYVGTWNAHQKDVLENRLHKMVCEEGFDLTTAQNAIRTNWIEAYKKYVQ